MCHSLNISYRLDFKNAEYNDFRNFKTKFCKNYLIPGETEARNVDSRVCRNKIGNSCSSVFFFVGKCYLIEQLDPHHSSSVKSMQNALYAACSLQVSSVKRLRTLNNSI